MSQTDKLVSLTGLSRVLNSIKKLFNTKQDKKNVITHTVGAVDSYSVLLNANEYNIIASSYISKPTIEIDINTNVDSSILNEYIVEFTTPFSIKYMPTIVLPSSIKWANGNIPVFEINTTYQISIINNLGIVAAFKVNTTSASEGGDESTE